MLHMIVNTHNAESCAFRPEAQGVIPAALGKIEEAATSQGATVQGAWVNLASHHVFLLVDAPNAHAIDMILRESGLIGYTDTRVFAVNALQEALALLPGASR